MSGDPVQEYQRAQLFQELERRAQQGDTEAAAFVQSVRAGQGEQLAGGMQSYTQENTFQPKNEKEAKLVEPYIRRGEDVKRVGDEIFAFGDGLAPTNITLRDQIGWLGEYVGTAMDQVAHVGNAALYHAPEQIVGGVAEMLGDEGARDRLKEKRRAFAQNNTASAVTQFGGGLASALIPGSQISSLVRASAGRQLANVAAKKGAKAAEALARTGRLQKAARAADTLKGQIAYGAGGGLLSAPVYAASEANFDLSEAGDTLHADIGEVFGLGKSGVPVWAFGALAGGGVPAVIGGVRGAASRLKSKGDIKGRAQDAIRKRLRDPNTGQLKLDELQDGRGADFTVADATPEMRSLQGTATRGGGTSTAPIIDFYKNRGRQRASNMNRDFQESIGAPRAAVDDIIEGPRAYGKELLRARAERGADKYRMTNELSVSEAEFPPRLQDPLEPRPDGWTYADEAAAVAKQGDAAGLGSASRKMEVLSHGREALAGARSIPDDAALEALTISDLKRLLASNGLNRSQVGGKRLSRSDMSETLKRHRDEVAADPDAAQMAGARAAPVSLDDANAAVLDANSALRSKLEKYEQAGARFSNKSVWAKTKRAKEMRADISAARRRVREADELKKMAETSARGADVGDDMALGRDAVSVERLRGLKTAANDGAEAAARAGNAALARSLRQYADRVRTILAEGVRDTNGNRTSLIGDVYHAKLTRVIEAFEMAAGVNARTGARQGGGYFREPIDALLNLFDDIKAIKASIAKGSEPRLLPDTRKLVLKEFSKIDEAIKVGAARAYSKLIEPSMFTRNAKVFAEVEELRPRLRPLFKSDAEMEAFLKRVDDVNLMKDTDYEVAGGSPTQGRAARDAAIEEELGGRQFEVGSWVYGGINRLIENWIIKSGERFNQRWVQGLSRRVLAEVAEQLSRKDLAKFADELRAAEAAGRNPRITELPKWARDAIIRGVNRGKKEAGSGGGSGGSGGGGVRQKRYSLPPEEPDAVRKMLDEAEELRRGNDATKPPPRDVPMQESRGVTPRDAGPQPPQLRRGPWSDEDFDAVADMAGGPGRTVNRGGKPAQNMPVNTAIHHLRRRQSKAVADERTASDLLAKVERIRATRDRMGQKGASLTARRELNAERKVAEAEAEVQRLHGKLTRGGTGRARKRIEARLRNAEENLAHWRDEARAWADDLHSADRQHRKQIDEVRAERDHLRDEMRAWADDAHAISRDVDATQLSEVEKLRAEVARLKAAEERALVEGAKYRQRLEGTAPSDFDMSPDNARARLASRDETMNRIQGDEWKRRYLLQTKDRLKERLGGEEPYIDVVPQRPGEGVDHMAYDPTRSQPRATFEVNEAFLGIDLADLEKLSRGTPEGYRLAVVDEEVAHRMFDINHQLPSNRKIFSEKDLKILRAAGRRMISEHKAKTGVDLMERYKHMPREIIEEEHAAKFLARGALNTKPDKFTQRVLDALSRGAKKLLAILLRREMRGADLPTNREAIAANKMADRFRHGGYRDEYLRGTDALFGD